MGYYTYFTLQVEGGPAEQRCPTCGNVGTWEWEEVISKFLDDYDPFNERCKWYDWESNMVNFSKLYPEYLFIIEGVGDDPNDRWKAYIKNGKFHQDQMIMHFPTFDVSTLE